MTDKQSPGNPYAAPRAPEVPYTDAADGTTYDAAQVAIPMPWSIRLVVAAMILAFAAGIVRTAIAAAVDGFSFRPGDFVGTGIWVSFTVGLLRRHRLAWQWGRYVSGLFGIVLTVGAFLPFAIQANGQREAPNVERAFWLAGGGILLIAVFIALGRRRARQYFRLQCPKCGSFRVKAADFIFDRAKCSHCRITW